TMFERYHNEYTCPISGSTTNMYQCPLIPYDAVDADAKRVAAQEWIFGLRRGGLYYYLQSQENHAFFREDISDLFERGEFILAPTYKTYLDTMDFMKCAGIKGRRVNDKSARRPLYALASAKGTYRYVFIPCTDAARALQKKFKLQAQTKEDLNGGICPVDDKPYEDGSDQFPVVECLAHPFSVCSHAYTMFIKRSTILTSQWHVLCGRIIRSWLYGDIDPPAWFLNEPRYGQDDEDLAPSEATGYLLESTAHADESAKLLESNQLPDNHYCKKCTNWTLEVPPDAPPPEEDPPHSVYRERRSVRIAKRAHPYYRPPRTPPAEEDCSGPLPSPTRKGRRALQTCKRDPIKNPPSWAARNGKYPTQTFCSNDWAYFRYNVYLASFDDR
ncbi:hypothetical protein GGG16DRAFT_63529, partial [Schizophyllum commune]